MESWCCHSHSSQLHKCLQIGFGAGHSTYLYLNIAPTINLYTFEIFMLGPYQERSAEFIKNSQHGSRWTVIRGDSNVTVRAFAAEHPEFKCDILHIDGNHDTAYALEDFRNSKPLSRPDTVVLIDDVDDAHVKTAMEQAEKESIIHKPECIEAQPATDPRFASLDSFKKTFCFTTYIM